MKPTQYFWNIESTWEKYYNPKPSFYTYSDICTNKIFDTLESENFVFFDEYNIGYKGLQKDSCIEKDNKPVFIVDNHHRVLKYFFEVFQKNKQPLTIIHVDAHRDDALYICKKENNKIFNDIQSFITEKKIQPKPEQEKRKQMIQTIENSCRVCDYLDCGKQLGLINIIEEYTQSSEFKKFTAPTVPYILNLDIDIYGKEGSAVCDELKTKVIAQLWNNAEAICIATSPAFIDRKHAERLITFFVKKS